MRASLRIPFWNPTIQMMAFRASMLPSYHTEKLSPLNKHGHYDMNIFIAFHWLEHSGAGG